MSKIQALGGSLLALSVLPALVVVNTPKVSHAASLVTDSQADFSTQQGYKRWFYFSKDGDDEFTPITPVVGTPALESPDGSVLTATGGEFKADSSTTLVRRWVSHLKGEILLKNIFEADAFANLDFQVVWNKPGEDSVYLSPEVIGEEGSGNLTFQQNLDISVGDSIDIIISAKNLEAATVFRTQSIVESKSLGGFSFINSREGQIQPPYPENCGAPIPFQFKSVTASTIGSFIRSGPCLADGAVNVGELPQGTPIALDAWTAGGPLIENYDLPGTPDEETNVWYRLAGTDTWISASIVTSPLPVLPTFDYDVQHIGLRLDGTIQEAYKAYTLGSYWDPIKQSYVNVPNLGDAVTDKNSPGSFQHRSPNPVASPVMEAKYAVISESDADAMTQFIDELIGSPYLNNAPCPVAKNLEELVGSIQSCLVTPAQEKGIEGGQYTATGLLEIAAEMVGAGEWGLGEGFIPGPAEISGQSNAESIMVDKIITPDGTEVSIPKVEVSVMTPWLLFGSVTGEIVHTERWIQGILESVDGFVLIDPSKNKLGYLSGSLDLSEFSIFDGLARDALFNNILGGSLNVTDYIGPSTKGQPNYDKDGSCPEPDLVEKVFQFHVTDRNEQGRYSLWIFGKNKNSKAYVGTESTGTAVYPGCDGSPIVFDPTEAPEPSLGIGALLSLLGLISLRRKS